MTSLRSSLKVGAIGIMWLVAAGSAVGWVLAGVAHFFAFLFYPVLLLPAAWGAGLGVALRWAVRLGACRDWRVAVGAGAAAALFSYGLFHARQNERARLDVARQLGGNESVQDPAEYPAYKDHLQSKFGGTGFWAELRMRASMGMRLRSPGPEQKGRRRLQEAPAISGSWMYLYWFVEAALIVACCIPFPLRAARRLYCEPCGAWYVRRAAGWVSDRRAETALEALERRDYAVFAGCMAPAASPFVLWMEHCPRCEATPVRLLLEAAVEDSKGRGRRKALFDAVISRESWDALVAAGLSPPADPGA